MDLTVRARTIATPKLGRLLMVVLVVALVALAVWLAGAGVRRLPAPFGPASNGGLLSTDPGDIYISAADGSGRRPLVAGDTTDLSPRFMRNGSQFLFWRNIGYDASLPMLANADGSDVVAILDSPLVNALGFDWSAADDRLAVVHVDGDIRVLSMVSIGRHTIDRVRLPVGMIPDFDIQWRAPDGRELVFTDDLANDGTGGGLNAVRPDGSGFRSILPVRSRSAYSGLSLSPDGRTAAVSFLDGDPGQLGRHAHIHFVDLDSGLEHRVVFASDTADETDFTYSPDGASGSVIRTVASKSQVLLVGLTGGARTRAVGPTFEATDDVTILFSPDGRTLVIHVDTTRPIFVDVATGVARTADVPVGKIASWQRLVP